MRLFKFELDKILLSRIALGSFVISIILSIGIFFVGYRYSQNYTSQIDNKKSGFEQTIDEKIKQEYAGDFTDDKIKLIISDYLDLRQNEIAKYGKESMTFSFYPFYWDVMNKFVEGGYPQLADKLNAATESNQERVTVDKIELKTIESQEFSKFDKPLTLGNFVPWTDFFIVMGNIFLLCNVLVILICSLIFSEDTSKNINQLLFSTKLGPTKLNRVKICIGLAISFLIISGFQLVNLGVFSKLFDISGGSSSIQTNLNLGLFNFPLEWSHWHLFFFILVVQILATLFTASLTMWFSSISKTSMSAFALSLGIFFLPNLLKELIRSGIGNQILSLFPVNLGSPATFLKNISAEGFLLNGFVSNSIFIIMILCLLMVAFNLWSYLKMKNWRYS